MAGKGEGRTSATKTCSLEVECHVPGKDETQNSLLCSNIYLETWYLSGPLCDQVVVRRSQMPVMAETQGPAGGYQKQGRSTAELDRGYCRVTKENSLRNL